MQTDKNSLDYLNRQVSALKLERQSFIDHYRDLAEFVQPRKGRFFVTDRNKGDKRWNKIVNSAATQALRQSRGGMVAGVISAANPWFRIETHNPDLMDSEAVQQWCYQVEKLIRSIYNSSNFYNMAPSMIGELLLFGTGAMSHVDDYEDVARFYTHTAGSYMIGQNDRYEVDTFARENEYTVGQIVEWFGLENVSTAVKDQYDRGNYQLWYPVNQLVELNPDFVPGSRVNTKMKYRSTYWEPGNTNRDPKKFLSRSGFNEFPVYCPRWEVTGEDIYGTDCPGMTALGDVKGLQVEEKRKAQAIDKMVNPPLKGPSSLRNTPINSLAGGVTLYDGDAQRDPLAPLYQVQPRLQELMMDMEKVEQRIQQAFFVDLFMAITNMEGIQPQNQLTILQRNQERLLQLGPVLQQMHGEWLTKMIDRTFNQCVRANLLPPAPPELQGQTLRVEYISSLAMAQKAVTNDALNQTTGYVSALLAINPQAADKFDTDYAIETFNQAIGGPPRVIVPDEQVAAIRQQRAQQMAEQQAAEQAQAIGGAANNAAGAVKQFSEAAGGTQ